MIKKSQLIETAMLDHPIQHSSIWLRARPGMLIHQVLRPRRRLLAFGSNGKPEQLHQHGIRATYLSEGVNLPCRFSQRARNRKTLCFWRVFKAWFCRMRTTPCHTALVILPGKVFSFHWPSLPALLAILRPRRSLRRWCHRSNRRHAPASSRS